MKNLKLTGVGSYSSPALPGNPVTRGTVIRVTDAQAEDLLQLSRDALEEDISIPYFELTDAAAQRDFTGGAEDAPAKPTPAPAAAPAPQPVADKVEDTVKDDTGTGGAEDTGTTGEVGATDTPAAPVKAAAPARARQRG
jgi:hypothetical protein